MTTPAPGNSRDVISAQRGIHQHLEATVRKHVSTPWRKPVADFSRTTLDGLLPWLTAGDRPLIIDACCGTGMSTRLLAARYPHCRVLGLDKSAQRVGRHQGGGGDYQVVRADVQDMWRLLRDAGIKPVMHTLFYPNPYPKAAQLGSRWYGSPAFPALLNLGGHLQVRSNWALYIEEFAFALKVAGYESEISQITPTAGDYISLFEKKYSESGHVLTALSANLNGAGDPV